MPSQTFPLTPLLARMRGLPASRALRLRQACELASDSGPLVADMLASAELLEGYGHVGALRGPRADLSRDLDEVAHRERGPRTADFALWLSRREHLSVAWDPHLDCEYVDRELVPARGARPARAGDGRRAAGLRLDLLLVNATRSDRTPVVAEVKIGRDKDPFAGLVQALTGLVHLATAAQYRRLRHAYPRAAFPERDPPPPMDAYVLCVDPSWETPLMGELLLAARQIASNLSRAPATASIMRRAVVLAVQRQPGELWSHATRL